MKFKTNSHYQSKHFEQMLYPLISFGNCGMASIHQISNTYSFIGCVSLVIDIIYSHISEKNCDP